MRRATHWRVPLVLAAASILAEVTVAYGRHWLRYDRASIADGEFWRLVTGHIVHLNAGHLALNLAGLILVWLLVGSRLSVLRWWLVVGFSLAVIDTGFWYLSPDLIWYVGMSGLLHGLLMAGVVDQVRDVPGESIVLALFVIGKLIYEQVAGPLPGSEMSTGGPVIVNAHLYGAIGGTLSGAMFQIRALRSTAL